jgi:hypothetical protein
MRIHNWLTLLLIPLMIGMLIGLTGCTQGQMAPAAIKTCLYDARADAIVTADEMEKAVASIPATASNDDKLAVYEAQTAKAILALRKMGGTAAAGYNDGLLSPLWHYFTGTKAPAASTP